MQEKKAPEARLNKKRLLTALMAMLVLVLLTWLLVYPLVQRRMYPLRYADSVAHWAGEYGVDPYLVYAVMRTESSFEPDAESSAAARGLMQMTEETFAWVKSRIARDEALVFDDLYTPDVSIRFGTYLLAISLEKYGGDISTSAAAYHSGWGTVDRLLGEAGNSEDGVVLQKFPYSQMGHYVNKINKAHRQYIRLYT